MDSSLAVSDGQETLLNVNDCEFSRSDCYKVKSDIGAPDVVLNQFSIAGYSGEPNYPTRLPQLAKKILDTCVNNHRDLGAKWTVPVASFVEFCQPDNKYVNEYHNKVTEVFARFEEECLRTKVLFPGDEWEIGDESFCDQLELYIEYYKGQDCESLTSNSKAIDEIQVAYLNRYAQLSEDHWWFCRQLLSPIVVEVPDIGIIVRFSFAEKKFEVIERGRVNLVINSQPLWFMFTMPFGFQTLGVSARYVLADEKHKWMKYRIFTSLNNVECFLSWKFFKSSNLIWISKRLGGSLAQIAYKIRRM